MASEGFAKFMMVFCAIMIILCFVGMAASCNQSSNYSANCHDAGGTVAWGGRGGSDSCFSADGRRLNDITHDAPPKKEFETHDYRKDVR